MNALQEVISEQETSVRENLGSSEAAASEPLIQRDTRQIQRTLTSILNSVQFRSSKQCQDLLRYVIEQSLNDQGSLLRERVIGAAVFGRRPDYDTANDPVVRARMAEVRKRLAQYYQSEHFEASQARIEIPPGHYRAIFRSSVIAPPTPVEEPPVLKPVVVPATVLSDPIEFIPAPAAEPSSIEPARLGQSRKLWVVAAVVLICVAALSGAFLLSSPKTTAFDLFWAPVLHNPMPVIIYTGTNVVYRFSPEYLEQYRKTHHLQDNGPEFGVDLANLDTAGARSLQMSNNAYVTTGDVSAATAITSALVQLKKPFALRFAQDISPGDLHAAPIVLLGAFNNPWTLNTTAGLRFSFANGDTIHDSLDPKQSWRVNVKPDGSTTDDYAIISRLISGDHREIRMTAAGIGQYGTQAAAEFLGSPEKINAFARTAPAGWDSKNLQIVIHVKVLDEVPSSPETVAVYQW